MTVIIEGREKKCKKCGEVIKESAPEFGKFTICPKCGGKIALVKRH